jgi:hypothetical protein
MPWCTSDLDVNNRTLEPIISALASMSTVSSSFNYTDDLVKLLPDHVSTHLPCEWESVRMTQSYQDLYELKPDRRSKLKIRLTFEMTRDTFTDQWAFSTIALLSNIFGIVGLFLGYSVLDIHALLEVALTRLLTQTCRRLKQVQ